MAPWIPRLHLFEIADQSWFPPFLRAYVQTGLTHAWTTCVPVLQSCSPAALAAHILRRELGGDPGVRRYTYIDFCAGAGGPTPEIERVLNRQLSIASTSSDNNNNRPSYAEVANPSSSSPLSASPSSSPTLPPQNFNERNEAAAAVKFILTDLHPHVESWETAARQSPHLTYVSEPVDAAAAPADLLERNKKAGALGGVPGGAGRGIMRLFNLAFHHFDDKLARAILKDTVETSDGFVIFELQSRNISSFVSCTLFGVFILLIAPLLYWWSPQILFFVYVVPIVPFVLVFDGYVSSLRTRTPDEVELLLRTCGAKDTSDWVVRSGSETFLWPCGHLMWIMCVKEEGEKKKV
ncbi:hypothetical protein F5Y17DRAFT_455907 [Xylariaceae sp. FL0594]|nr:hypothetical protein F5Y17DRAFT_455907 [Xylariaceae sp. FL0594]